MRAGTAVLVLLAAASLVACERDQSLARTKRASDTPAWQSSQAAFNAPGYAAGDKAAWESQLAKRAQGQNDYAPRQ